MPEQWFGIFKAGAQDGETVAAICLIARTPNINEEDEANAGHIVKMWNSYDDLLELLKECKSVIDNETFSWSGDLIGKK